MSDVSEEAIDRVRKLVGDAELFHLAQIPLSVKTAKALIELAELGIRQHVRAERAPD
jgi:hypothetical protein